MNDAAAGGLALACNAARESERERAAMQRVVDAAFELSDNARLADKRYDQYFKALDEALKAIDREPSNSEAGRVYEVNEVNERALELMAKWKAKRTDGDG